MPSWPRASSSASMCCADEPGRPGDQDLHAAAFRQPAAPPVDRQGVHQLIRALREQRLQRPPDTRAAAVLAEVVAGQHPARLEQLPGRLHVRHHRGGAVVTVDEHQPERTQPRQDTRRMTPDDRHLPGHAARGQVRRHRLIRRQLGVRVHRGHVLSAGQGHHARAVPERRPDLQHVPARRQVGQGLRLVAGQRRGHQQAAVADGHPAPRQVHRASLSWLVAPPSAGRPVLQVIRRPDRQQAQHPGHLGFPDPPFRRVPVGAARRGEPAQEVQVAPTRSSRRRTAPGPRTGPG